jgi:glutathione S-transferase
MADTAAIWVYLVILAALAQFLYFGMAVARARGKFGVKAPAMTGHPEFERYVRVQANTLELLIVLIPSLAIFGHVVHAPTAAALGAVYLVGRTIYFASYVRDPASRTLGFFVSFLPMVTLAAGAGIACALRATGLWSGVLPFG